MNFHFNNGDMEKKFIRDVRWFSKKLKEELSSYINSLPKKFKEMILYSLFPGGKRIRPILMFACGEMLGVDKEKLFIPASSIELIHNYSLIHDDLPSMDNDDYRRGKLAVHKKFGEANAILIGDGLLTLSFELLSNWREDPKIVNKTINLVSKIAGFDGLVLGQLLDLADYSLEKNLKRYIYKVCENKTAKLIKVCLLIPGLVARLRNEKLKILGEIGHKIGMLFQITDDLIDYISEQNKNKLCYPKVYLLDGTKKIIKNLSAEIEKTLKYFSNSKYFLYLVNKIAQRTN